MEIEFASPIHLKSIVRDQAIALSEAGVSSVGGVFRRRPVRERSPIKSGYDSSGNAFASSIP